MAPLLSSGTLDLVYFWMPNSAFYPGGLPLVIADSCSLFEISNVSPSVGANRGQCSSVSYSFGNSQPPKLLPSLWDPGYAVLPFCLLGILTTGAVSTLSSPLHLKYFPLNVSSPPRPPFPYCFDGNAYGRLAHHEQFFRLAIFPT